MILVDSSIWADHLRSEEVELQRLLDKEGVLTHPFVIGELAMGYIKHRERFFRMVHQIEQAEVATDKEVLEFIEKYALFGIGIGYIDAHLLASTKLTARALLWTRDRRLQLAASKLSVAYKVNLLQ